MADAEQAAPAAVEPQGEAQPETQGSEPAVAQEAAPVSEAKPEATDKQVEQAAQKIKQLKLKVDGKEIIENLPFEVSPEQAEYLMKELQMSKMAQKRAQEAAELRKAKSTQDAELNQFLQTLKNDPAFILQQMGIEPSKFAEEVLSKELEKMQLSPEQRKIQELEQQLKKIQDEELKAKKDKEEIQAKALRDKYAADYEKQLMDAMASKQIPNNPYVINKMVDYMSQANKMGVDITFSDLVPFIKEEMRNQSKELLQGMSVDEVIQLLSDQMVNDIVIKKSPKKEKKVAPPTAQTVVKESVEKQEDKFKATKKTKSSTEFFNELRMKYAGIE